MVVTSRPEEEIWASGNDIYPGWKPGAIPAICGTAKRILSETGRYLTSSKVKAYELPFHKVIKKDEGVLFGLVKFLVDTYPHYSHEYVMELEGIIRPDIVKHTKVK